jgi:hypothetical protein
MHKNIIKNCLYYKNLTQIDTIIISDKPYLLNSSSSSIINYKKQNYSYLLLTRFTNYKLDIIGNTKNLDNYNYNISLNKLYYLDDKYNIIKKHYYFTNDLNTDIEYKGVEDVRLFLFKNNIYYIGSAFNDETNKIEIVSDIFNLENNILNKNFIRRSFNSDFNWEKNWVFFENNNSLYVIYKWFPLTICNIDYQAKQINIIKEINNIPFFFKRFRGSTCGLIYDNKIWFIVHFTRQIQFINKPNYLHCFVVLDTSLNLIGYSEPFNFENNLVEYCIGLTLSINNNFIITYSCLDKTTKLSVFSPSYINSLIYY